MREPLESNQTIILNSPSDDIYKIGNLSFNIKGDYVLAASAMPELESPKIEFSSELVPELWRAWVVAIGPGIWLSKAKFTYNPGIKIEDYIYFLPNNGTFFSFDNVLFVFVKMSDVLLNVSV